MTPFLTAAFFMTITGCIGQDSYDSELSLPSKVRKQALEIVYKECPSADILEIESNEDYIEVDYLCDGLFYEIGIVNGAIIFKEEEVKRSDIPYDKISAKIHKSYRGYIIDEFSRVVTADTTFIRVEIIKEGIERNVYFTEDGKWYSSEWKFSDSNWSEETLESMRGLNLDFDLLHPHRIIEMPDILREISGIAVAGEHTVLCIQDEIGAVFEYDLLEETITHSHRFTDVGDFEDLTIKGDTVYVLRSDGSIFRFNFKNYRGNSEKFVVPTQSLDLEGLHYDPADNRFLMASKEPTQSGNPLFRPVYSFDPNNPHSVKTTMEIDIDDIQAKLHENFPEFAKEEVHFYPSAIAVRPGTGEIYILSAKDRLLAIYDSNKLKVVVPLSENAFYKPEGLDFMKNGDLLISSEGDKKGIVKPRIVWFKRL